MKKATRKVFSRKPASAKVQNQNWFVGEPGTEIKTSELLSVSKTTTLRVVYPLIVEDGQKMPGAIIATSAKDLMRLAKKAKAQEDWIKKKGFSSAFVHLSPDVSVMVKNPKAKK